MSRPPAILIGYCRRVSGCPVFHILLYNVVALIMIGALYRELKLDMDFDSFGKADGAAMRKQDAYTEANKKRGAPINLPNYTPPNFTWGIWPRKLQIIYVAKRGSILDDGPLGDIRVFESRLRAQSDWVSFCETETLEEDSYFCAVGESFINVRYPSQLLGEESHETHAYSFDGAGSDPLSDLVAFAYMMQNEGADTIGRFFPATYAVQSPFLDAAEDLMWRPPYVETMRSIFTVNMWINASTPIFYDIRQEASDRYIAFVREHLYEFLDKERSSKDYEHIDIYFGGDEVLNFEALQVATADTLFVIFSSIFVTSYMWLHTRSVLVSTMSLWIILLSIPMGYVLVPTEKVSVAAAFSLFLMMGVGCDVVFVFHDFWKQSEDVGDLPTRLAWTLGHAARSCLATSLTTSVSFFANVASALRPLREFGLFMGMCVMSAYVMLMLVLPPVTVVAHRGLCKRQATASEGEDASPVRRFRRQESMKKAENTPIARLVKLVALCPCAIVIITVLTILGMMVGIAFSLAVDTDVPEIFPTGHNQREFPERKKDFGDWNAPLEPPADRVPVCSVTDWETSGCRFHWCDALLETHGNLNESGVCWRAPTTVLGDAGEITELSDSSTDFCAEVTYRTRLATVGLSLAVESWVDVWRETLELNEGLQGIQTAEADVVLLNTSLVLENWERGDQQLREFYDLGSMTGTRSAAPDAPLCEVRTLCFFGSRRCELPGWELLSEVNLTDSSGGGRRLTQSEVDEEDDALTNTTTTSTPSGKQMDVLVVWGIRPPSSSPLIGEPDPLFSYDYTFQITNPWAQRAIYQMCTEVPAHLRVVNAQCWIANFRDWLHSQDLIFPSRDISYEVRRWWPHAWWQDTASVFWQGDNIVGCKVTMRGVVGSTRPAKVLEYMDDWEDHIEDMNTRASMSANKAFSTAKEFVEAEADLVIVSSTVETVGIAAFCAFFAMIAFTCDPVIASYVLMLVLGIIVGLLFFILVVFQWPIGPIEVISLIIFVGYAVTYSLHIAHNFAELSSKDEDLMTCTIIQEYLAGKGRDMGSGSGGGVDDGGGADPSLSPAGSSPAMRLAQAAAAADAEAEQQQAASSSSAALDFDRLQEGDAAGPGHEPTSSRGHPSERSVPRHSHLEGASRGAEVASAIRIYRQNTQEPDPSEATFDQTESRRLAREREEAYEVLFQSLPNNVLRQARAQLAVQRIGLATLSSAISTVGSSCVLFLCTILVFIKLAAVLTTVTVLSIVVALITLPAVLMVAGPKAMPWYRRVARDCIKSVTVNVRGSGSGGAKPSHSEGLLVGGDHS
mmetsp:Transcript_73427/g.174966  ORF Transcript_73427/g.174966 Transcript_73427/m.174966 type:complete len:1301 (+) Transcript_73427:141-4043(+)